MSRAKQERPKFLVELYLSWRLSLSHDAGWHGEHVIGRLIDFQGDLPPASGNDQADLKMINEIRFIRADHHETKYAVSVVQNMPHTLRDAVVLDCYARNRTFRFQEAVPGHGVRVVELKHSSDTIAHALGISADCLRQRIKRGYGYIEGVDNAHRRVKSLAAGMQGNVCESYV